MKLMQHHMILNWTARISGLLIAAFFAAFFIGEGLPDILNGKGKDLLEFIPYTLLSLAGYILAWYSPLWGGRLLIAGALLMAGYFFFRQDFVMALIYGLPSALTGLCFIAAANKELI
ncbi:MAG: hypothetical protein HYZ15_04715 [Sphingobacteriales bacterium]|nr:hypothetical protein [Sphingobacteriales bacterium]